MDEDVVTLTCEQAREEIWKSKPAASDNLIDTLKRMALEIEHPNFEKGEGGLEWSLNHSSWLGYRMILVLKRLEQAEGKA